MTASNRRRLVRLRNSLWLRIAVLCTIGYGTAAILGLAR